MTATTEVKDTRETAAAGAVCFASGEPLIRAISNGLLFSGSDDTLPALTLIRFEFDGHQLQALTTDRYRLCVETIELDPGIIHDGQPEFAFQLQRAYAKQALTVLKANRRDKVVVVARPDASPAAVEFQFYEQAATYPTANDYTFPSIRQLILDPAKRVAVNEIGFSPAYLADLARVQTGTRKGAVRIWTYGPAKPARIDYDDGPTVLLMPIKIPGDSDSQWGAV